MTGKPRNPGYIAGDHWGICDVCGLAYRQRDLRKRWDGAVVCRHDWEIRHPQDFVRARKEDPSPKGLVRSEPRDRFLYRVPAREVSKISDEVDVSAAYYTQIEPYEDLSDDTSIAGVAVSGLAVSGIGGPHIVKVSEEVEFKIAYTEEETDYLSVYDTSDISANYTETDSEEISISESYDLELIDRTAVSGEAVAGNAISGIS